MSFPRRRESIGIVEKKLIFFSIGMDPRLRGDDKCAEMTSIRTMKEFYE